MLPYIRLKQHINTESKNTIFLEDVQTLIDENEKYKKAHSTLKSCQYIAGVFDVDLLASRITELLKDSEILQRILETSSLQETRTIIEEYKKSKNIEE